jgi:hypothetical protein
MCAALLLAGISPNGSSADVLEMRTGYWAFEWTVPGQPPQRDLRCLTPEDLERMRFFIVESPEENCEVGADNRRQSTTTWEVDLVCAMDEGQAVFHYLLQATTAMAVVLTVTVDGIPHAARGNGAWLTDSCEVGAIPIV